MRDGMLLPAPEDDAAAAAGEALPISPIVLGVGIGVANVIVCELTAACFPPDVGIEFSCTVGADDLMVSDPDPSRDGDGGVGMTEVGAGCGVTCAVATVPL